jgi:hypothetical protein
MLYTVKYMMGSPHTYTNTIIISINIILLPPPPPAPRPVLNHGGVDFKTMANQTAARALEEVSLRVISVI